MIADLLQIAIALNVKIRFDRNSNSRFDFEKNTIYLSEQNFSSEDLTHELTHALQWAKGNKKRFELLEIEPTPAAIACSKQHHPLHQPFELEAYSLQDHPERLIAMAVSERLIY